MAAVEDSVLMAEWLKLAGYSIFDGWSNEAEIAGSFQVDPASVTGVIIALYGQESYEGSAFVLMIKEGKLFEVHGSHCSCMGLENQWEEEPTSVAALRKRSWPSGIDGATEKRLAELLDILESMEKHK